MKYIHYTAMNNTNAIVNTKHCEAWKRGANPY